MSFGFSLSDVFVSCQLAREIHYRCFTKTQGADVRYHQFGRDIKSLGSSLGRLQDIIQNANDQSPQIHSDDDMNGVPAGVVGILSEVTGDFRRTLRDCDLLLKDNSKFQRSAANFVDNVAWHTSTERDVNSLRERLHFHIIKVNFVAKPFEIQLLLGIRRELQLLRREVAALKAVLDWDPAQARYPTTSDTCEEGFSVPQDLSDRFRNALAAKHPDFSEARGGMPLKEGFDALVHHFAGSTVDFIPGLQQDVPEEQYLNLVKSRWIIERLKESTYFTSSGPESLWAEYMRELEDRVKDQFVRFDEGGLLRPPPDILSRLPDNCFSIWVDEGSSPRPAALTEHRPSEEKILELELLSQYSTHRSSLTVFRRSDIAFRLVTATKDNQNDSFHSEESMDVNMIQTGLVPAFATSQDSSIVNNNVLLCNQGHDTKYYNLPYPGDIAEFQRALTGFRVSQDMSNISWHIEFNKFSKRGISGMARLQFWQLKPLPKIGQSKDSEPRERSSSSSATPHSPLGSINLRQFWTSGGTQLPGSSIVAPVNGSSGDGIAGIALTRPEVPVLIFFTMCEGKYAFLHLPLDRSISYKPQPCVDCRNQKRPCSRILIQSTSKQFSIRRLCAQQKNQEGLASWNLGCFRYPEHPAFKNIEILGRIKYLSLHFDTPDKKDEFCNEFRSLENLRNRDLNDYERTISETRYLSNNMRPH